MNLHGCSQFLGRWGDCCVVNAIFVVWNFDRNIQFWKSRPSTTRQLIKDIKTREYKILNLKTSLLMYKCAFATCGFTRARDETLGSFTSSNRQRPIQHTTPQLVSHVDQVDRYQATATKKALYDHRDAVTAHLELARFWIPAFAHTTNASMPARLPFLQRHHPTLQRPSVSVLSSSSQAPTSTRSMRTADEVRYSCTASPMKIDPASWTSTSSGVFYR